MMKKLFIILFLFFLNTISVLALDSTFWANEPINSNDVELINYERRFKWYKETDKIYSNDYYVKGYSPLEYPYIVEDDYIETDFIDWPIGSKPDQVYGRIIEEKSFERYRNLRPIRYIYFNNFEGGYKTFKISELNILIDKKEIGYSFTCTNCSENFNEEINNGVVSQLYAYVINGGNLVVDLGNYYYLDQLRIELYMYDAVLNTKTVDIYFNEGSSLNDRNYAHALFTTYAVSQNYSVPDKYLIIPDENWITNFVYEDWVYGNNTLNASYCRQVQFGASYRYKDTKYRYYGYKKEYKEGFYAFIDEEGYINDQNQYMDYYQYKVIANNESEDITNDESNNSIDTDNNQNNETEKDNVIDNNTQNNDTADETNNGENSIIDNTNNDSINTVNDNQNSTTQDIISSIKNNQNTIVKEKTIDIITTNNNDVKNNTDDSKRIKGNIADEDKIIKIPISKNNSHIKYKNDYQFLIFTSASLLLILSMLIIQKTLHKKYVG